MRSRSSRSSSSIPCSRSAATSRAQDAGLPVDFLLVIVGLTLLFMVFIEYLGRNREMGRSYVSAGLREGLRIGKPKR